MFFEKKLLSYKQAALYLGISVSYLRELKARGQIKYVPMGSRGVKFNVLSLDSFIERREVSNETSKVQED